MRGDRRRHARGFTYIGILFAVALIGVGLAGIGTVWRTSVQRERERELLFIGHEFRRAIARHYAAGGGVDRYPRELADLLNDQRFPVPRHHLRRLYRDPMTGEADWQLVMAPDGGIMGVYSASQGVPIKRANFDLADAAFALTECYCDWQFIYEPRRAARSPGISRGETRPPG
jgi:type II secretory pathway pseudopilin PulG